MCDPRPGARCEDAIRAYCEQNGIPIADRRTTSARAARFFGDASQENIDKLRELPAAFQNGTVGERAEIAASSDDADILEAAVNDSLNVRRAAAHAPGLTVDQQMTLANDSDMKVRRALRDNPNVDDAVLAVLEFDAVPAIAKKAAMLRAQLAAAGPAVPAVVELPEKVKAEQKAAALAAQVSPERIAQLDTMDSTSKIIRSREPDVTQAELEHLFTDADKMVRWNAARTADAASLSALAKDRDRGVRQVVATRSDDPAVLDTLASDRVEAVREKVAVNPNTSDATLEKLAPTNETAAHVLGRRVGRDNVPVHLRTRADRAQAAHSSKLTPDEIEKLTNDPAPEVRLAVARRQDLSPGDLQRLHQDPDAAVRARLADNSRLTPDLRYALAMNDPEVDVRVNAIRNGDDALRRDVLKSGDEKSYRALSGMWNLTAKEARTIATKTTDWETRRQAVRALEDATDLEAAATAAAKAHDDATLAVVARKKAAPGWAVAGAWKQFEAHELENIVMRHRKDADVMALAARSRSNRIKSWAASSTATPVEQLEHLAEAKNWSISEDAKQTLRKLREDKAA